MTQAAEKVNASKVLKTDRSFFSHKEQSGPLFFQPKLSFNQPYDPESYRDEREADAMADKVMRMTDKEEMQQPFFRPSVSSLQRKCAHCEEEEKMMQRKEVNGKEATTNNELESYVGRLNSGGQPLPNEARNFYESRFGYDFSQVKVHTGTVAAKSAQSINALAYTSGNNIVFNNGQYSPGTDSGKRLLGHELAHVVQQQAAPLQSVQRLREDTDSCPEYDSGEVTTSRSENGHLAHDVELLGNGRILISDFGVDWRHAKSSLNTDPLLQEWMQIFEENDTYQLKIIGYSDCHGGERGNISLRQERARNIETMLGEGGRGLVTFRGMASLNEYLYSNDSIEHRAKNRGVIIEISQEINFVNGEIVEVEPRNCGPDITTWLIDQMNANMNHPVIRQMREVEWPRYIPIVNIGWTGGALYDFAQLVKPGGIWDFKARQGRSGGAWRANAGRSCPTENCDQTITICGHCLNYDVPGNIHFGWVGAAGSLRSWLLHFGADIAQIVSGQFGDDPRDSVAVAIGEAMWDSSTFLCDGINTHFDELNLDHTNNCFLCGGRG